MSISSKSKEESYCPISPYKTHNIHHFLLNLQPATPSYTPHTTSQPKPLPHPLQHSSLAHGNPAQP
ncbi:hypothetical protein M011DRAFT_471138 [Sporormia fimetaria CBS 119925]|uniref:Uncharacterized protein n=1 Tax=Sporormia fimetaria CBS 119925 TaxID=1340428 RepID=A0A6A6V1K9_9PLEO|nr:hypothetical protein M011DRAFT_471138 [Sporormia fimetaria CBS 119925]